DQQAYSGGGNIEHLHRRGFVRRVAERAITGLDGAFVANPDALIAFVGLAFLRAEAIEVVAGQFTREDTTERPRAVGLGSRTDDASEDRIDLPLAGGQIERQHLSERDRVADDEI